MFNEMKQINKKSIRKNSELLSPDRRITNEVNKVKKNKKILSDLLGFFFNKYIAINKPLSLTKKDPSFSSSENGKVNLI